MFQYIISMQRIGIFSLIPLLVLLGTTSSLAPRRPNLVLIMGDDIGWSDVGFSLKSDNHPTSFVPETPHLDKLAASGIILQNLYTQNICTPTRAAILTGKLQ